MRAKIRSLSGGSRGPKVKYFQFSPTEAPYKIVTTNVDLKSCTFRNKNKNGSLC